MGLRKIISILSLLALIGFLAGCGGGGGGGGGDYNGGDDGNHAPTITALNADPTDLWPGAETALTCQATDEDGDSLSFSWSVSSGNLTESGDTATWQAPDATGDYVITCNVTDGQGGSDDAGVTVAVALSTVTGMVIDQDTGEGIAQVQIALDGSLTAQTQGDGSFQVAAVPQGDYSITVNPPSGYILATSPDSVTVSEPNTTVPISENIELYDTTGSTPPPPPEL